MFPSRFNLYLHDFGGGYFHLQRYDLLSFSESETFEAPGTDLYSSVQTFIFQNKTHQRLQSG